MVFIPLTAGAAPYLSPIGCNSFDQCIRDVVNYIGQVAIPIAIVMFVIGGFMFVTAGGSEERVSRGKKTLTWAAIGFVIILIAFGLATAIEGFLNDL